MPVQCEECGEEKGYDDVVTLECELGYGHPICLECMISIKRKANAK